MNELEQGWLSVELIAVEEEVKDWNQGLKESFGSLFLSDTGS